MPAKKFGALALALWTLALFTPRSAEANPASYISEPAPYGHPFEWISFETVSDSPDWERVESINGDKLYPYDDDLEAIDLIVFYHGVGYGTQGYVLGNTDHGIGAAMASAGFDNHSTDVLESEVLILVPRGASKPFSEVEETIRILEEDRGIHIRSITIGGWSGGAVGLTSAMKSEVEFRAMLYADPSPEQRTMAQWPAEPNIHDPSMLVNWYRYENWGNSRLPGGWYGNSNPKFLNRFEGVGGVSYAVDLDHNEILLLSLVTAIQIARMDPNT
jgi:hypothetical protein